MKGSSIIILLFIHFIVNAQPAAKIDTIRFSDNTYLIKAGDCFVNSDMAKIVAERWRSSIASRNEIGRGLYHSWHELIGLRRECLVEMLGQAEWHLPDRYIYQTDFTTDGIYWGCWINVEYRLGLVSYIGVVCPN